MTTIRQAHNKKYTCVSNELCQDANISFSALGLLIYLLSLPDNWNINVSHLCTLRKEKRKGVLSLLNELKKSGYVYLIKTSMKSSWEYIVFEKKISESEFKEFLRTIPSGNSSCEEQFLKEQLQSTKENIDNKKEEYTNVPLQKREDVNHEFIKENKEKYEKISGRLFELVLQGYSKSKRPDINKWCEELDKIHRLDGHSLEEIEQMIEWSHQDNFWKKNIRSPESLRKHWEKMAVKKFESPVDQRIKLNRSIAEKIHSVLKNSSSSFAASCSQRFFISKDKVGLKGGDWLLLSMDTSEFERILIKWFNLEKK